MEPDLPHKRILLVEDDDQSRTALQLIFEQDGYYVRGAREGREGIELVPTFRPHVIILDLALPGMNGFDAAEVLKSRSETCSIPLIAVTASWLGEERNRLMRIGFDSALRKPVPPALLLNEVRKVLGHSESEDRTGAWSANLPMEASPIAPHRYHSSLEASSLESLIL